MKMGADEWPDGLATKEISSTCTETVDFVDVARWPRLEEVELPGEIGISDPGNMKVKGCSVSILGEAALRELGNGVASAKCYLDSRLCGGGCGET